MKDLIVNSMKLVAIGLLITVTLVLVVNSQTSINSVSSKQSSSMLKMVDRKYSKYEGENLNGADVVNAIRGLRDSIKVTVKIDGSTKSYDASITSFNNKPSDSNYINPALSFTGVLNYDANGTLVELLFTKK